MTEPQSPVEKGMSRPSCPFYGFYQWEAGKVFVDQKGNQCPLREGYFLCFFAGTSGDPNWKRCPINREDPEALKSFETSTVFADEFGPEGIPFKRWAEYIL